MNIAPIIIETLIMTIAFTAMILVPLIKNPVWWIHDYPADIQEEYFKTHDRVPTAFFSKTTLLKKGFAIVLVIAIFMLLIWLSGTDSFLSAFAVSYGIWTFINWYDCFILDWVFFANLKSIRLPGTEHMDKAYHQKKYHFIRALWGMLIGLIPCLVASWLYTSFLITNSVSVQPRDEVYHIQTSDSVDLYVHVKGQGEPCLYLHGGPGAGSTWMEGLGGGSVLRNISP